MALDDDPAEFVDSDFQAHRAPPSAAMGGGTAAARAPTREEVDSRVLDAQQKLAELKRAQEDLERERAALEETRRRQREFQTGRGEMIQNLTRGVGLLEEAEFAARRDAEQMAKALAGLREALTNIQSIHEESWTKDNFSMELTRGLTTLENARMEWNGARLKFPVLTGSSASPESEANSTRPDAGSLALTSLGFGQLCRLGLALTWPLVIIALLALGLLAFTVLRP